MVFGWETPCLVADRVVMASDRGEIPGVTPSGALTTRPLCCEGSPSVTTADQGCEDICILEACEAARIDHINRCTKCGAFNCGFDMSDCLSSPQSVQTVICLEPLTLPHQYTLTAVCSAFNNQGRNDDGSFLFLQHPVNNIDDDPLFCNGPEGQGVKPPRGLGQFSVREGAGSVALVTWTLEDLDGEEQSDQIDAHLEYGVIPCSTTMGNCVELASLVLTLPTTQVLGMTVANASLQVISVEEAPEIAAGGSIQYSEGALGILLRAQVDGTPLILAGYNSGNVSGLLAPEDDVFSLTGLRFEFDDGVISAMLEADVHGHYEVRAPTAEITLMPPSPICSDPVTFLATSWDPDLDIMSHRWWIEDVGTFHGSDLEVALGPGAYTIVLTTEDSTGSWDTETLYYTRSCQ